MNRSIAAAVLALIAVTSLSGCGGKDEAAKSSKSSKPAKVTTPGVQADGNYQLGTMPSKDAAAAVKAAAKALPVALSYDYRTLDKSLKKATALMTPTFAAKFKSTFAGTTVAMATEKKAITTSLVRAAGLVGTIDNDRALCMIYLDQVLVSSKDKKASDPIKVSQNSVHVSLRKIDGVWKVDNIEPF